MLWKNENQKVQSNCKAAPGKLKQLQSRLERSPELYKHKQATDNYIKKKVMREH